MYAALPMYDLAAVRPVTDALWRGIRDNLRRHGIAAPDALTHDVPLAEGWLRPDLVVSQTCGLPFVRHLRGKVRLVGAVDHGLPDIPPGHYCSRIVVRREDLAQGGRALADYRGRCCAFNAPDSQSGAGAMRHLVMPLQQQGRFFGRTLQTGSHFAAMTAVAEQRADIAAVDAATWRLAEQHLPEARALTVLTSSEPTPGLPLITALDGPAEPLFRAITAALAALTQVQRSAIGIHGLVPRAEADFAPVAAWDAEAKAAGYRELDG